MDPADLSVVIALEKSRTFAGAARDLGVAHTTVSRKLRALEAHYQAKLFESSGDGVVPTPEGEHLLASAHRIGAELSAVERAIKGTDNRLSGEITLTTVDVLAWHYMDRLARFRAANPDIILDIEMGNELRSLSRREAEMALRLTNAPDEYLFGRRVGRMSFYPYVQAALMGERDPSDAIAHLHWVDYGTPDCSGPADRWLKAHVPRARRGGSVPTPLSMLRALSAGMGIGLLPDAVAAESSALVRLQSEPAFEVDVWLLAPEEIRRTARIRAMFDAFSG